MAAAPLVTFVIAGVQKGGTTALYDYLADYPDVALSRTKELHFFDDETVDWRAPDYAPYHAQFAPPQGRPCGEVTPSYLYLPNAMERIQAYNPAMRLIVILRDPVQRAWSNWRMEYARGFEQNPFAWCIRQGRQRLFDSPTWGHQIHFAYVERGFYGEQFERLYGLFPRDQVLVLRAEDLRADHRTSLDQVRGFLDLPLLATPAAREAHVGKDIDYGSALAAEDVAYLRQVYSRDQARLRALTGLSYP
jgi:hypothetical protein